MDVNLALISGRLALPPDLDLLPDGSQRARMLVCVRSERRRRFDVLPVVVPPEIHSDVLERAPAGARVLVAGSLMRWCSPGGSAPPGRIEVIASALRFPEIEDFEPADNEFEQPASPDGSLLLALLEALLEPPDVEDAGRPR